MADEPVSANTGSAAVRPPLPDTVDLPPPLDLHEAPTLVTEGQSGASTASVGATAPIGEPAAQLFGDYELLGEIGRGGMGVVYRARERHSGRLVALKMMLRESADSQANVRRFILEARATGELNHPGIVAIHAWGEDHGQLYYTMDFVPGVPLNRMLVDGPLPCERAVRYFLGIARAVAAAHALGIVHRDLKPGNVIIDSSDQPRILDFGLAKRLRTVEPVVATAENVEPVPVTAADSRTGPLTARPQGITEIGAIVGTPSYMAPEQVRGEPDQVGPPADVHALGAMFYEMLAGRPPFQSDDTLDTLLQVVEKQPPPLRSLNPKLPATLEAVCRRCLRKSPQTRYPNAGALAADLERHWQQRQQSRLLMRRTAVAALAVLLLQALLVVVTGWLRLDPRTLPKWAAHVAVTSDSLDGGARLLGWLLWTVVVVWAPLFTGLGLLVWSAGWVRHAPRPGQVAVCWTAGVCVAVALSLLVLLPLGDWLLLLLPVVVALSIPTALGTAIYRLAERTGPADAEAPPGAESYLRKLFARRVDTGPTAAARQLLDNAGVALEHFELGKSLHNGDGLVIRWARQKSLDRPVLVWVDTSAVQKDGETRPQIPQVPPSSPPGEPGEPLPGMVVNHPDVLRLYAVGGGAEGRFLVTESVAAASLAEILQRRQLTTQEAIALVCRLAHALQAFHEQGACHGRLQPQWILVHGDLEPVLCPCGVPSQSPADQQADLRALGALLLEWLPRRPAGWRRQSLAPLYRVADAALAGNYERASELAADLDRAARAVDIRWRERWTQTFMLVLFCLPLLALGIEALFATRVAETDQARPAAWWTYELLLAHGLWGACAAAMLLGYSQGRGFLHRAWLRASSPTRSRILQPGLFNLLAPWSLILLSFIVLSWLAQSGAPPDQSFAGVTLVIAAELLGYWFLGTFVAGLITYIELLGRSLPR
jgi:serine/threonine-protein kinase